MSVRFGIIGYGFMGHIHEEMLSSIEGIQIIGIADIDEKQMKDVKTGIVRYGNPDELIANPDIDVVLIAANNNKHKELVCKAARAGKNIICEKPVALTVAELDEMIRVTDQYGVRFTVHQQRRLDPDFRTVKNVYDQKSLGQVYTIKSSLYGYNGNMHDWHVYLSEGGGMLLDWGVHLLDQILWMVDSKIKSVYADMRNVINFEVDDYFKIIMKFENGITAEVELGTYYLTDKKDWFSHHWFMGGNKGSMYLDGFNMEGKIVRTTALLHNVSGVKTMTAAGPTRSFGEPREGLIITEDLPKADTKHREFFENYIRAYKGEEEFLVNIPQVRRVMQLMEAVRESGKTGNSVSFE